MFMDLGRSMHYFVWSKGAQTLLGASLVLKIETYTTLFANAILLNCVIRRLYLTPADQVII